MVTFLALTVPGVNHVPTTFPGLSTNILIIAAIVLVTVYGFVAGHAALIRESISVYVGLVLATSFGAAAYKLVSQGVGSHFPVTQTEVRLLLLLIPILLLQFGRKHEHNHKHNAILTLALALLTAMLIVSSVLAQLDPITLSRATNGSMLASWIYDFRLVWLAAVPIAIGISALLKPKHKGRHGG